MCRGENELKRYFLQALVGQIRTEEIQALSGSEVVRLKISADHFHSS
jgi:hypothetical protein